MRKDMKKEDLIAELDHVEKELKQARTECENWEESYNKLEAGEYAIRENFNNRLDCIYEAIEYLLEALKGSSKAHALVAIDRLQSMADDFCDEEQS